MISSVRLAVAGFGLLAAFLATEAQAQTPPPDLIYTRVKPCRVFDTTRTKRIPATSAKSFLISGPGDYAAQGGTPAGCGVPAAAAAVSLNLTAINAVATGSFTAQAYAQTSATTVLRYPATSPTTVGAIVDLLQNKITLRTTNTVNAIGDVTGYYAPALYAYVYAEAGFAPSIGRGPRATFVQNNGTGVYLVFFDRVIGNCVATASVRLTSGYASTSIGDADQSYVQVNLSAPGGAGIDVPFYVLVTC